MNRERLLQLANAIELNSSAFDIQDWGDLTESPAGQLSCETTACIAGFAIMEFIHPEDEDYNAFATFNDSNCGTKHQNLNMPELIEVKATILLGLTDEEADRMFRHRANDSTTTAKAAVEMLRYAAEKDELPNWW